MSGSVLVFDVGSSALKAAVFDGAGTITAQAEIVYPKSASPHQQLPDNWWRAAAAAVEQLEPSGIDAIALTGAMENLIPVKDDGRAAGEAILYSDPCGSAYLEALGSRLDETEAAAIAGNAPEPLMSCFKLHWLREHRPHDFAASRWFLPGAKDFVALQLTGRAATDPTTAATTGLMNISTRRWDDRLLALHGLSSAQLPEILPATAVIGPLTSRAAGVLGLEPAIPVVNGCGDAGSTTIGGGADRAEDTSLYLGTTGWVARVVDDADSGPKPFYRLPHPLTDSIIEIAPIMSAGASAQWARETLRLELDEAEEWAAVCDARPEDLVFLPYLNGERFPFTDLELRGAFLGMSPTTSTGALYYAALEGVAFAIRANLEAMGGLNRGMTSVVGGGALSATWRAILADVLNTPISVPANPLAATAFGAFRIAQAAMGRSGPAANLETSTQPRPDRAARIARLRRCFDEGTKLARSFARLHSQSPQ